MCSIDEERLARAIVQAQEDRKPQIILQIDGSQIVKALVTAKRTPGKY